MFSSFSFSSFKKKQNDFQLIYMSPLQLPDSHTLSDLYQMLQSSLFHSISFPPLQTPCSFGTAFERLTWLNYLFPLVRKCFVQNTVKPIYVSRHYCFTESIRNVPEGYLIEVVADFTITVFAVKMSNLSAMDSWDSASTWHGKCMTKHSIFCLWSEHLSS